MLEFVEKRILCYLYQEYLGSMMQLMEIRITHNPQCQKLVLHFYYQHFFQVTLPEFYLVYLSTWVMKSLTIIIMEIFKQCKKQWPDSTRESGQTPSWQSTQKPRYIKPVLWAHFSTEASHGQQEPSMSTNWMPSTSF